MSGMQASMLRRSLRAVLAGLLVSTADVSVRAESEIVYDNIGTSLGGFTALDYLGKPTEFGDEIALAGTARIITQFVFKYFGDFTLTGDETARVRFYANDGAGIYPKPKTVLYDSGAFLVTPGEATVTITVPKVEVPDSFTWTVSFGGVTQTDHDKIELIVCDPPTIGAPLTGGRIGSYWDYWKYNANTWSLFTIKSNVHANFAARVVAETEDIEVNVSQGQATNQIVLSWTGRPSAQYSVETSCDLREWTYLDEVSADESGVVEFQVTTSQDKPLQFFRVRRQTVASPQSRRRPSQKPRNRAALVGMLVAPASPAPKISSRERHRICVHEHLGSNPTA